MPTPEQAYFNSYSTYDAPLTPAEDAVYDIYVPRHKKQETKITNFRGIYPDREIEKDIAELKAIRKKFKYKTQESEILEAVLAQQIDQADWFGEECSVVQASEYDDTVHHTDLIVEFHTEEEIRLAVDVTTSEDHDNLKRKTGYILQDITKGTLTTLKYFYSEDTETKGEITQLPRVIIGVDREGVKELCGWVEKTIKKEKGSNRSLANHYIQLQFLHQAEQQLIFFINYAKNKKGYDDAHPTVANQQKVLNIIQNILENKKSSIGGQPNRARDNAVNKFLVSQKF